MSPPRQSLLPSQDGARRPAGHGMQLIRPFAPNERKEAVTRCVLLKDPDNQLSPRLRGSVPSTDRQRQSRHS
jgi:hypothetical protein